MSSPGFEKPGLVAAKASKKGVCVTLFGAVVAALWRRQTSWRGKHFWPGTLRSGRIAGAAAQGFAAKVRGTIALSSVGSEFIVTPHDGFFDAELSAEQLFAGRKRLMPKQRSPIYLSKTVF